MIFFRHFRLPLASETSLSVRSRQFPIIYKKPFDDISNLWPVIWSSDLGNLKKATSVKLQFARIFVDELLKQFPFQVMTDTEMFIEVFVEKRTGRTQR